VGNEMQQLGYFGLKGKSLFCHRKRKVQKI
jgi:hypothetical protein